MSFDQALAFALFAVVAAVTPGPSNIILASTGANVGVRRGIPCLLGVAAGMGLMMFIVAYGLGNLVMEQPLLLNALKWGAVGFLLWLAWKIATANSNGRAEATEFIGFWRAAAFQWVNPKSWLVSASAVGAFLATGMDSPFVQAVAFGLIFLLVSLPSCFVWLALGATMQRFLHTERARRSFNIAMGVILAASILIYIW